LEDNSTTTTWWMWQANIDDSGVRVIVEVKTAIVEGFRTDTPVSYFAECEIGGTDLRWLGDKILIENEQFARLRAAGAIQALSPAWAVRPA
jgi:hypothetical protein